MRSSRLRCTVAGRVWVHSNVASKNKNVYITLQQDAINNIVSRLLLYELQRKSAHVYVSRVDIGAVCELLDSSTLSNIGGTSHVAPVEHQLQPCYISGMFTPRCVLL